MKVILIFLGHRQLEFFIASSKTSQETWPTHQGKTHISLIHCKLLNLYWVLKGRHDTQHNDIEHVDTRNEGLPCDTQRKGYSTLTRFGITMIC